MYRTNSFKKRPYGRNPRFNREEHFHGRNQSRNAKIDISKFINTNVTPKKVEQYIPEHKFSDFNINQRIKNNIADKGYLTPTPIQDKAIPQLLKGLDLVGIANTGTGKTGAFIIPLINKVILSNCKENVLIIAPTRELAIQIDEEFKGFSRGLNLFSVCCVGGVSIGRQIQGLRHYHNFIIGTPGRIKDLAQRRFINFLRFGVFVLDEADRMLDMGFIDDMRFIASSLPKNRQTLLFSATISSEIENLISEFTNNSIRVSVKTPGAAEGIHQDIVRAQRGVSKIETLHNLLIKPGFSKVLIFGRTKMGVERLSRDLSKRGFRADSIHGDKNQAKRQRALSSFKGGKTQILIATDVAARGLDINGVSHVINYDLPATYNDYIHRIGRTGRAGKEGYALTFIES